MNSDSSVLHGSLWKGIFAFSVPVAATSILEQLFNASDVAIVGSFSSADRTVGVAAVGANSALIGLIVNLFIGIALGATVVIANAIGAGDKKTVHQAVHTSILMALAGGLGAVLLGELAAPAVLGWMQVPAEVYPYALLYLRIYLCGLPVILLYNFEAAIFRSTGETKIPLAALFFAGVLNVILNLFFVIVLGMSVDGVATATVIANAVSSFLLLAKLCRTDSLIHVSLHSLRPSFGVMRRILAIGLPAGLQSAVFSISNIVIQTAVNSLGTLVMAASSAAFNIEVITYDLVNAFSQACTTFTGQNFGAMNLERGRKTLKVCLTEGAVVLLAAIGIMLVLGKPVLALFNADPRVIDLGYYRLCILMVCHMFTLLYEVQSGYLRGFGISLAPALLTMLGVCGIRILWVQTVFAQHPSFQLLLLSYPVSLAFTPLLLFGALCCYRPARKNRLA